MLSSKSSLLWNMVPIHYKNKKTSITLQRITKKKKKKIDNLLPAPAKYAFESN